MPPPIKVVVADDDTLLRAGLCALMGAEDDLRVVGEAADGAAAVDVVLATHPDVVLMDIRMPRLDGITATRRLLAAGITARVLMLTTFDADEYVVEAFRAGAAGFLFKDGPPHQIASSVRTIAGGDALLAPALTSRLIQRYVGTAPQQELQQQLSELTERERQVLEVLASGKSNADIGRALFLSEGTVKTHLTHVLAKLGLNSRVQAVVFAYESGLVRPGGGTR